MVNSKIVRNNRLKLIGLFAIVFVPMAAATSMYFGGWGVPVGSTNKGQLIWPPLHIADLQAVDHSGEQLTRYFAVDEPGSRPLKWDLLKADAPEGASQSQWVLLVTGNKTCDQACEQALYTIRQVNIALGKESERVSRVMASAHPVDNDASALSERYPMMELVSINGNALSEFAGDRMGDDVEVTDHWNIWVVDPLGNVILRYEAERNGKDILKDMKRLLKLSNVG